MNIHEYQAKTIFRQFGLKIPSGKVFDRDSLSVDAIRAIGLPPFVIKAQIHAGGRGKAGGIKIVETAEQAFEAARKMLGTSLVTYQTAGVPKPIDRVLIEMSRRIQKELYLAVTLDRERALPCVIFSEAGGIDIEEVAQKTPEKIVKFHFDLDERLRPELFQPIFEPYKGSFGTGVPASLPSELAQIVQKLAEAFVALDASLVEVNPLGLMADGSVFPIDAKVTLDDNGLFRHPEMAELYDSRQEDPRETEAKRYDLSYVGLDGNIGCMVNGAGLAMATMDIIKLGGGEPANFLDVGGGATKEKVAAAFKIILKDPRVKAILVNIFGGIMRCDVIAEGILQALEELDLKVPLVVKLEGTNVKEGKAILAKSKISIVSADSFADGAAKVVALARK